MTTQVRNQRTWRNVHKPLALLPILIALFSLALLAHAKSGQDERRGARDITHVQIVIGKKNAWLNLHPVLLKVSQISFGGMPGSFLTDTCWLLIKAVSRHPHPRTPDSQQTTWFRVPGQVAQGNEQRSQHDALTIEFADAGRLPVTFLEVFL